MTKSNEDYNASVDRAIKAWKRPLTYREVERLGELVFDANHAGKQSVTVSVELLGILFMGHSKPLEKDND